MRGWLALVVVVAACSGATTARPAPHADLLITNARVYTGDPAHPWADSLAIRGGRIVEATVADHVIDAGGRVVIPGINDAHLHAPDLPASMFVEVAAGDDLLAAIAAAAKAHPPGTWLHGDLGVAGVDDPALTRAALDAAAPEHPVMLDNFAGHIMVLNSAAMQVLGVADDRLFEYDRWRALRQLADGVDDDALLAQIAALSAEAAAAGITTLQVMPITIDHRRLLALLERAPPSVRWRVIRFPIGAVAHVDDIRPVDPMARISLSGTKYILDGTPIERGAAMEADYADRPGERGHLDWSRQDIAAMMREALQTGDQLHLHVAGDLTLHTVLDVMAETGDADAWRAHRLVIEHGDALGPADFARARELGVIVVQNPSHFTLPDVMRARLGDRADDWFQVRAILDAGIPLALGSDGPLDPFLNILFAASLTREQAIAAYTSGSAYDEHLEADKGRLVPGMLADLAILSADPFTASPDDLPAIHSELTLVGGEVVHDTGTLTPTF
jgi:predicted amidohydrolase YtcJ